VSTTAEERLAQLRPLLEACLTWMEQAAVTMEGEWGSGRTMAELEAAGELPPEIVRLRAALCEVFKP
jgi:hypothetical protein